VTSMSSGVAIRDESEVATHDESGYFLTRVFGDPVMARIFSLDSTIESWLEVERSLAWAEVEVGLLDAHDARAIENGATLASIDRSQLWEQTRVVGYPILPLIRMIAAKLPDGPDGRVHFGATTQDIMDSGLALQLGAAAKRLKELLVEFGDGVAQLVVAHRDTVMAARTHDQQAVPTTFGAKLSSFLGELARDHDRLVEATRRISVVSLYGAGGTSAALGSHAQQVRSEMAQRLGLDVSGTSWHAARDSLAEFGMVCAMLSATAARFANEIINLSRTELGEVSEDSGEHHYGASSTMPQKVNPIQSEVVVGMSIVASSLAAALCRLMVVPHERAAGEWQAEWQVMPQLCDLAAGSLRSASNIAHHMSVHPDAMAENLKRDNGLVLAEAFMIGLAEPMGREAAHDLVYEASMEVRRSGVPLGDVLRQMVSGEHSENLEVLIENTRPETYVGESRELCDRGLGVWRQATVGE